MLLTRLKHWFGAADRRPSLAADDRQSADAVRFVDGDLDDEAVISDLRKVFLGDRETAEYQAVYRMTEPLVTVCITTSDRGELLSERALKTMAGQTYRNLQVTVVGDCCEDDTAERVAALNDRRFTFINLPQRGPYPPPGRARWCVHATNTTNEALRRARGDFITHLDEDDTFAADRIATLVAAIQATRADIVYHPFWWQEHDMSWTLQGDGRFTLAQTGTGMVLYHRWLARIPRDVNAFRLDEPGDWNRFRKFAALGARTHNVPIPLTWHWAFPRRGPFVLKPNERFLE